MAATQQLRTERLEILAASAESLEAEMLGREALARRLRACIPEDWPPEGFDRSFVEWAAGEVRKRPPDAGWLVWFVVLADEPEDTAHNGSSSAPAVSRDAPPRTAWSSLVFGPAQFQSRRFATEAISALLDWAFIHRSVSAAIAQTRPENAPSVRALEKNGFRPDGAGREEGMALYRLTRADHHAARLERQAGKQSDESIPAGAGVGAGAGPGSGTDAGERPRSTRAEAPPCPRCGSRNVAAIAYGFPDPIMFDAAARGEIELGAASSRTTVLAGGAAPVKRSGAG